MNIQFSDDTKYPLEASESGDNAHYFTGCPVNSGRLNYASCLAKCKTRKAGRLGEQYSDCSTLIGKKECLAQKMRLEEIDKGQAIYFVSRPKLLEHNDYRLRVEREKWAHLQETGKRLRKPLEGEEGETPEDVATFNPTSERGYRPPVDPLIERQTGLGTYAWREYSQDVPAIEESGNYAYGEVSVAPGAAYKSRADQVVLGRSSSNHDKSEVSALAAVINESIQNAMEEPARQLTLAEQVKLTPMLPGETPIQYATRVSEIRKGKSNA